MIQLNLIPMKYSEARTVAESLVKEAETLEEIGNSHDALQTLGEAMLIEPRSEERLYILHWIHNLNTLA